MAKRKMNLIEIVKKAYAAKEKLSDAGFEQAGADLLIDSYKATVQQYQEFCAEKGREYHDEIFYVFQHVLVYIMMADGELLRGEYDAYSDFCRWAKFKPLTTESVKKVYERLTREQIVNDVLILNTMRLQMSEDSYENMVQGFAYIALTGDHTLDENEFYMLVSFFDEGVDEYPTTWEECYSLLS